MTFRDAISVYSTLLTRAPIPAADSFSIRPFIFMVRLFMGNYRFSILIPYGCCSVFHHDCYSIHSCVSFLTVIPVLPFIPTKGIVHIPTHCPTPCLPTLFRLPFSTHVRPDLTTLCPAGRTTDWWCSRSPRVLTGGRNHFVVPLFWFWVRYRWNVPLHPVTYRHRVFEHYHSGDRMEPGVLASPNRLVELPMTIGTGAF